jgi:hypothetical protein
MGRIHRLGTGCRLEIRCQSFPAQDREIRSRSGSGPGTDMPHREQFPGDVFRDQRHQLKLAAAFNNPCSLCESLRSPFIIGRRFGPIARRVGVTITLSVTARFASARPRPTLKSRNAASRFGLDTFGVWRSAGDIRQISLPLAAELAAAKCRPHHEGRQVFP